MYLWSDGTLCEDDELEEYLKFMSDDFIYLQEGEPDDK